MNDSSPLSRLAGERLPGPRTFPPFGPSGRPPEAGGGSLSQRAARSPGASWGEHAPPGDGSTPPAGNAWGGDAGPGDRVTLSDQASWGWETPEGDGSSVSRQAARGGSVEAGDRVTLSAQAGGGRATPPLEIVPDADAPSPPPLKGSYSFSWGGRPSGVDSSRFGPGGASGPTPFGDRPAPSGRGGETAPGDPVKPAPRTSGEDGAPPGGGQGGILGRLSRGLAGLAASADRLASRAGEAVDDGLKTAKAKASAFGKEFQRGLIHGAIDRQVDKDFERFEIPKFEETGITDQSTSEDMTSRQFKEFKKVEKFAHRVMKEGRAGVGGKPPDLSNIESDTDKLKAVIAHETRRHVEAGFKQSLKRGVLGSLDSGIPAGERYGHARELARSLESAKESSKEFARGLYDKFEADPKAFLEAYEEQYRKG